MQADNIIALGQIYLCLLLRIKALRGSANVGLQGLLVSTSQSARHLTARTRLLETIHWPRASPSPPALNAQIASSSCFADRRGFLVARTSVNASCTASCRSVRTYLGTSPFQLMAHLPLSHFSSLQPTFYWGFSNCAKHSDSGKCSFANRTCLYSKPYRPGADKSTSGARAAARFSRLRRPGRSPAP